MKRALQCLCVPVCLLGAFSLEAQQTVNLDEVNYIIESDSTATVGVNEGINGDLTIPSTITANGRSYTVKKIVDGAFGYGNMLGQVTLPNTITYIGDHAFENCGAHYINIPDSVTYIGDYTFANVRFDFYINRFDIPNSVTYIGEGAFRGCNIFGEINIPASVEKIGNCAFASIWGVSSINVSEDNENYTSLEGVLYNKLLTELMQYPIDRDLLEYSVPGTVNKICDEAFSYCESLQTVTLPNTLTEIGDYVFYRCSSLSSVNIPNTVKSIGSDAFRDCSSLTSIILPNSVESIGSQAFTSSGLISISIPGSVKELSSWICSFCSSLQSVTLSDSLESIGHGAFYACKSLKSVMIPKSVTKIDAPFGNCSALTEIIVNDENESFTSVEGVLFNKDMSALIQYPAGKPESDYSIPGSVTSIGESAFETCGNLTSVVIPKSVKNVGRFAFYSCPNLISMTCMAVTPPDCSSFVSSDTYNTATLFVPEESVDLYRSADYWKNFTNIVGIDDEDFVKVIVADGLHFIIHHSTLTAEVTYSSSGLNNYPGLKSVIIPETIENDGDIYNVIGIGYKAFYVCGDLTSVEIPNSVTIIGDYAFDECRKLKSIKLPDYVTYIGEHAFYACRLESVNIPNTVTQIGSYAFSFGSMDSVIIPDLVTTIGDYAFAWCNELTSVTIPASTVEMGIRPFSGCSKLTEINVVSSNEHYASVDGVLFNKEETLLIEYPAGKPQSDYSIPNTVTSVGWRAFESSDNLKTITIPRSVKSFDNDAFFGCDNLETVTVLSVIPPLTNYGLFESDVYTTATLYVPDSAVNAYKSAAEWENFVNIVGIECNDTVIIDGLRYVINHVTGTAKVVCSLKNSLSNYEGRIDINIKAFVEVPAYGANLYTVVAIDDEAFNNCWGLKTVTLPSTIESIGKLAFGYCTSLRKVEIPDYVTVIDNEAFTGCSALASVQIGKSVETIGDYAFFGCTGLASLHVPESVKTIGENAFMGIHWINEVYAKSDVPADAPVSAFSTNAYSKATLVVPDGSLSAYKSHPTWSNFLVIRENGDTPTKIEVIDGAIEVKGAEVVRVYNASGSQVYSGSAGRIELPSGIYLVVTDNLTRKVHI